MASLFPGMDPYLEDIKIWPDFHHTLIMGLNSALMPNLDDRYRLRLGTRCYINEQVLFVSVIKEEHREEFLEIRQRSTGRLVTVIDLISPANRTTAAGRQAYLNKRQEFRQAGAHLVEIDLVLQGKPCLDIAAQGLPPFDYVICVGRTQQPDRFEIYTTTLQKRLPRFRMPLAVDDRDVVVDLQTIYARSHAHVAAGRLDYQKDPPALLKEEDHRWMVELFKQHKLRK